MKPFQIFNAVCAALLPGIALAQGGGAQAGKPVPALAAATPASAASASTQAWQPAEAEKTQVNLLTQRYFQLRDRGDFTAAYAMLSPDMRREISLERWSIQRAESAARMGEVKDRSIRNIAWYTDPPTSPLRGVFAAVDYTGMFQNADIHCGVLVWHKQPDGSFKLLREEVRSIDKPTKARMSAEQLSSARKAMRC